MTVFGGRREAGLWVGGRSACPSDPCAITMPGAIATNFARNFDTAVLQGLVGAAGAPDAANVEITKGERLPDDVLAGAQAALPGHLCTPEDVAEAVVWAVTRPASVHVSEIVVRPKRDLNL